MSKLYVQRDKDEKIIGTFANPQPGFAEEAMPEDHPEVVEFHKRQEPPAPVPHPPFPHTELKKD